MEEIFYSEGGEVAKNCLKRLWMPMSEDIQGQVDGILGSLM